jgi:hypothetical protein
MLKMIAAKLQWLKKAEERFRMVKLEGHIWHRFKGGKSGVFIMSGVFIKSSQVEKNTLQFYFSCILRNSTL